MGDLDHRILCIKGEKLFTKGKWEGLQTADLDYYYQKLLNESEFRVRRPLETNPTFKQHIVQIILRYKNKYFLHHVIDSNEKRLIGRNPLPVGGHIEEFDLNTAEGVDLIQAAITRELAEEVEINARILKKTFLGPVYLEADDPVNACHIGIVYIYDLDKPDVNMNEVDLAKIGWVDLAYLKEHTGELSWWTNAIIKYLK